MENNISVTQQLVNKLLTEKCGEYDQTNPDRCLVGLLFKALGFSLTEACTEMYVTLRGGRGVVFSKSEFTRLFFWRLWPEPFKSAFGTPYKYSKYTPESQKIRHQIVAAGRLQYFIDTGK